MDGLYLVTFYPERDNLSRFLKNLTFKNISPTATTLFTGECWSGPNAQDTFFAQGAATDCNNDQCCDNQCYGQCRLEDSYCTGRHLTAAVYGIGKFQVCRHSESPQWPSRISAVFRKVGDVFIAYKIRRFRNEGDWAELAFATTSGTVSRAGKKLADSWPARPQ